MIQTYRAWLNDDPESNETVDFILPQGACVGETWSKRIWQYHNAKNALARQMCMEVMALKRICLANKLPKDMYNLLKNEYIKRQVTKLPKTNVQQKPIDGYFVVTVFAIVFAIACFLFTCDIAHGVLYESKQNVPQVEKFHFGGCNPGEKGDPGPPGIVGPTGPPGRCEIPAVKGESFADYTIIGGKGINVH